MIAARLGSGESPDSKPWGVPESSPPPAAPSRPELEEMPLEVEPTLVEVEPGPLRPRPLRKTLNFLSRRLGW
jgi:hypothetical protein